jgi:uncharacterized protein YcfL
MTKTGAMLEPWRLTTVHANRTGFKLLILSLALLVLLAGCRNETQNRIRRDLQDYTGGRTYITVYSVNGTPIFEGVVDGQVTRSVSDVNAGAATELSSYVYWFDAEGQYYQTDMPYLLSSRAPEGTASTTTE